MGHFDQIPSGRPNGFHLGPKDAWKGNQPSRRVFRPELFAIWAPRRLGDWVWTQDGGMTGDKKIVGLWRDSAANQAADNAAPAAATGPDTLAAPAAAAPAAPDSLAMSSLNAANEADDVAAPARMTGRRSGRVRSCRLMSP